MFQVLKFVYELFQTWNIRRNRKLKKFTGPGSLKVPIKPKFLSFNVCVRIIPNLEHKAEP